MTSDTPHVRRLQILLDESCCAGKAREDATHALKEFGLELSGEGLATVSARVSDTEFRRLFPAGPCAAGTLVVPAGLKGYVSSITEAPEHLSFD